MSEEKKTLELKEEELEKVSGGDKYDKFDIEGATEEFVDKGLLQAGKLYYQKFLDGKMSEEEYRKSLEYLISLRPQLINNVNKRKHELLDEIDERIRKELGGTIFF